MTRGLPTEVKDAFAAGEIKRPVHFVELDFTSGKIRVNSTDRPWPIDLDGDSVAEVFVGAGKLGKIEFGDENAEGRVTRARLTLSGIPGEYNAAILSTKYRNRRGVIWRGYLNADYELIATPAIRLIGLMQPAPMRIGTRSSTVSVDLTSRLSAWERHADAGTWDDADLQFRRPGDLYHEFAAEIAAGKDVPWGRS